MPLSVDIRLPRQHTPKFPDRCVACGLPSPGAVVGVRTFSIGWWTLLLHPGRCVKIEAPACRDCRRCIHARTLALLLVETAFVGAGFALAVHVFGITRGPFRRWIIAGICLIVCLPLVVWEVCFPPPFGITAFKESLDYEFRDAGYAADFAAINETRRLS